MVPMLTWGLFLSNFSRAILVKESGVELKEGRDQELP